MKFLLDTNFFLIPGKFKVDIISELGKFGKPDLYTLDLVISELEKIVNSPGKDRVYGKIGLQIIKDKKIKILDSTEKKADEEILRLGRDYIVCTQDRGLIKKLKGKTKIMTLRQRKYLVQI